MKDQFLWGAATSSHQIEGNNIHNDWWQWENEGNIEGGVSSGIATDHWNRFREDLRNAAELGLGSYRFSVEWSRVEPEEGNWSSEALEWYAELVAECERLNLVPMLTLHHFTLPRWVAERGGFVWEGASGRFAGYVKRVVAALGARIPLWCTLNEPNTLVVGSYLGSYMPPARRDPKAASTACRNLLRAHVLAYDLIHSASGERRGPWKHWRPLVGIAHNMIDFVAERAWHPAELAAAKIFRRFYDRSWLDAVTGKKQHFGVRGMVPYADQVTQALGRRTVDFIGINYYTKIYVSFLPSEFPASSTSLVGITFSKNGDTRTDMGWVIHPRGLGKMIDSLKGYGLPLYVTENGIADAQDSLRPAYLLSHVREIASARARGADVRGYYHWSLIDNFEWVKGFGPRFGLFEIDYATLTRTPRRSAHLYREIIASHGGGAPHTDLLDKIEL